MADRRRFGIHQALDPLPRPSDAASARNDQAGAFRQAETSRQHSALDTAWRLQACREGRVRESCEPGRRSRDERRLPEPAHRRPERRRHKSWAVKCSESSCISRCRRSGPARLSHLETMKSGGTGHGLRDLLLEGAVKRNLLGTRRLGLSATM